MALLLACAGSKGLTVASWRRGRLHEVSRLAASEDGCRAFRDWLAARAGAVIRLTVETPDEDYRVELLPHARGSERRDLIERRLQQFYRDSRFRAARIVQTVKGRRREDRCLFAALTDDRIVAPWLEPLDGSGVLLAGIFPTPLLLLDALHRLRRTPADVLLITQGNDGVRQTFVQSGWPRMTRVTALPQTDVANVLLGEIRQTRAYLEGTGLLPTSAILHVLVLDAGGCFSEILEQPQPVDLHLERLPPAVLARAMRLPARGFDAATLHLQLLARHVPALNLAGQALRIPFVRRCRARRMIMSMASLVAASAIAGAFQAHQALHAAAMRQMLTVQSRHAASPGGQTPHALLPDRLMRAMTAAQNASASEATQRAFRAISGGFQGEGERGLMLVSLRWQPDSGPSGAAETDRAAPMLISVARLRVLAPAQDLRRASGLMQAFVAAVGQQPFVRSVAVTAPPAGLSTQETLRGGLNSPAAASAALEFEVSVRLSLDHEAP